MRVQLQWCPDPDRAQPLTRWVWGGGFSPQWDSDPNTVGLGGVQSPAGLSAAGTGVRVRLQQDPDPLGAQPPMQQSWGGGLDPSGAQPPMQWVWGGGSPSSRVPRSQGCSRQGLALSQPLPSSPLPAQCWEGPWPQCACLLWPPAAGRDRQEQATSLAQCLGQLGTPEGGVRVLLPVGCTSWGCRTPRVG